MFQEVRQPVYQDYFADPFVWRCGDCYFAVGTGRSEAEQHTAERVFPLLRSVDLRSWEAAGRALVRLPPEYGDSYWAPEVAFHEGRYYLYYSVGFGDTRHQLRVATSHSPLGPFQDCGHPLIPPDACPFAIDASPFRDDDGQWYLFFARDYLDTGGGRTGTGIAVVRLKSMTEFYGQPQTVLRARHDWQRFQANRSIYGSTYDWHTLEGPSVCKRRGRYFCFYSAGRWENETYGVDYACADHVLGPYLCDADDSGPRILRTIPGSLIGPGHNSIVTARDGEDWIAYHAWDPAMIARRMFLDRLTWNQDGPQIKREHGSHE